MLISTIWVLNASSLPDSDIRLMARACNTQIKKHFAPAWHLEPAKVKFSKTVPEDLLPHEGMVFLLDNITLESYDGFHSKWAGRTYAHVSVNSIIREGGTSLYHHTAPTVASVLSHEILELLKNPTVKNWVDGPKRKQGFQYRFEVCDPVQADAYAIKVGSQLVNVSNFVLPQWFDSTCKDASYDYLDRLKKPFSMTAGGYMVLRDKRGKEHEIHARALPLWEKMKKAVGI